MSERAGNALIRMRRWGVLLAAILLPGVAVAAFETAVVTLRDVERTWPAEGTVEAVRQATVAAQIAGRIVEVRADAGDVVAKGQVLARIDEREAAQVVASSEAQSARAEADLSNARANLERTRKLVEQKFVSQAALDKAQADFDVARAQLAATRAGTGQAVAAIGYATITAPFAGVVAARQVQQGDMAQPGMALFVVFDPKDMRVVASVPQAKVAEIRANSGATVELPSLAQSILPKAVTVLPSADARTHTTLVRLDLPEGTKGIYPGMFARARFPIGRTRMLVIPDGAVVYRSEVAGAYVVGEKGEIRFRQLRLGEPTGDGGIEVLAGLQEGERVSLDPASALAQLKARGR